LRDLLNADFNRIVVNDKNIYQEAKTYIQRVAPEKAEIVSFYQNGSPIFDSFGVTKQVKAAFGKTVSLNSGAYLIIEHTEALHVIDVNSGYKNAGATQEDNSLQTNLEAAQEIARQLRLRDIGGIIVVDFIDMKQQENKKKLHESMEEFMNGDRARHSILPISKFGLMQITRQRMKPELEIKTDENCPACHGTGKITSTLLLDDEILKNLDYLVTHGHKGLTLMVHPIFAAYLLRGFPSIRIKWSVKFRQWLKIKADNTLHLTAFRFLDKNEEEIKL
jgi:ribonuclease G